MERTRLNDWMTLIAAAALAAFTGMIAGAIFAGEAGTFREWVSALSGWVAGIGAVMVGVFTIRPLVRQVQLQEVAAQNTFMTLAEAALRRTENARRELSKASAFVKFGERLIPASAQDVARKSADIQSKINLLRSATHTADDALSDSLIINGAIFAKHKRLRAIRSIGFLRVTLIEFEVFNYTAPSEPPSTYNEIRAEYERLLREIDRLESEAEDYIMDYFSEIAALL